MRWLRWRDDRGAAAVEFAILAPVLIVLLLGIVEFGFVFNTQLQLSGAAREGAREMAITGDTATASAAALGAVTGLDPALTDSDVVFSSTTCAADTDITVTIGYDRPFLTGLFGPSIRLEGTATRRCGG